MTKLPLVTITITGPHDSGRTTLAVLFQNYLKENGYTDVVVKDTAPLAIEQKASFIERFTRNRDRPHVIEVRTEVNVGGQTVVAPAMVSLPALPPVPLPTVKASIGGVIDGRTMKPVEQTTYVWPELNVELLEKGGTRKFIVRELDKVKTMIRGEVDGKPYACAVDVFEKVWR